MVFIVHNILWFCTYLIVNLAYYLANKYLEGSDLKFSVKLSEEILNYKNLVNFDCKSVLLLPPLPSHLRYLTHQLAIQHKLTSFSVGHGDTRRTVIASKTTCLPMNSNTNKKYKPKRPDQPLYVPKHLRTQNVEKSSIRETMGHKNDIKHDISPDVNGKTSHIDIKDIIQNNITKLNTNFTEPNTENGQEFSNNILKRLPSLEELPLTNNYVQNKCSSMISSQTSNINDEDSWFSKFTDDGDAVDPNIMDEITDKVGKMVIKNAVIDYSEFTSKEIDMSDEEYCHLLEIYDFPKEFATQDLLLAFKEYQSKGFDIKWVDDTHAIAIFEGSITASNALRTFNNTAFKIRPMSQASRQTKLKAKRCTEFLFPQRPRPAVSVHVARNLLVAALGIKSNVSKEQRAVEHKRISEAREKKKADVKCKQDAWEGTFRN